MKSQRKAREAALQVLFQRGFQEGTSPEDLFYAFADHFKFDQSTQDYALKLTQGILGEQEKIDQIISQHSENWRIDRIAMIDRILLQIAIYEMCLETDAPTPPKLVITDILDLAKKYSSEDSKNFINGIIDRVYQQEVESQ